MATYMTNDELQHYGVKGMKWGVRKRYITGHQIKRNASRAAEEARKNSIAESRASGDRGIGSFRRVNQKALAAKKQAYGESMERDRAYNESLRAERKQLKADKKAANAAEDRKIMDARQKQSDAVKGVKNAGKDYALATLAGDKKAKMAARRSMSKMMDSYMNSNEVANRATSGEKKAAAVISAIGAASVAAFAAKQHMSNGYYGW